MLKDLVNSAFAMFQSPLDIFDHPSGVKKPIHEWIDELENLHGDGKEKQFRIWLDKVSASHVTSESWLVKFDKHEVSGKKPTPL